MELVKAQEQHINELRSWFSDQRSLESWAGPGFRYPFTAGSFAEDLNASEISSFVLVAPDKQLLAFGQYYLRIGRCHLGRLAVNPELRGRGLVAKLITGLMAEGKRELAVDECSLFVLADNESAIIAYKKVGFVFTEYPDQISLDNCLYMYKA